MNNKKELRRGQIWMADLPTIEGKNGKSSRVQAGRRPVIIIGNDMSNKHSTVIKVVPLTTQSKAKLPTHVTIPKSTGLIKDSIALCEQDMPLDTFRLQNYLGECDVITLEKVTFANGLQDGQTRPMEYITGKLKAANEFLLWFIETEAPKSYIEKLNNEISELMFTLKIYCKQTGRDFKSFLQENNLMLEIPKCSGIKLSF